MDPFLLPAYAVDRAARPPASRSAPSEEVIGGPSWGACPADPACFRGSPPTTSHRRDTPAGVDPAPRLTPSVRRRTPPPAISMANEGVENLSGDPTQGHPPHSRRAGRLDCECAASLGGTEGAVNRSTEKPEKGNLVVSETRAALVHRT